MATRQYAATRFDQHGQTFYLTAMPAGDLLEISQVDAWNPDLTDELENNPGNYLERQGYQRKAEPRHYGKVSNYVIRPGSILPTSILISSRTANLVFKPSLGGADTGSLEIPDKALPLWIVDGQHRLEGIRDAIEKKDRVDLRKFKLPVTIVNDFNKFDEVNQFHTINTTAKGVRADLAHRLLLEMEQVKKGAGMKNMSPGKEWRLRATKLSDIMNREAGSPWEDRIQTPNSKKGLSIISEQSFATSLKPILSDSQMRSFGDDDLIKWITAYWQVVEDLMPEAFKTPKDYAIQKTPGVYTLHMVAPHVFHLWRTKKTPDKNTLRKILTESEGVAQYFGDAEFWRSGMGEGAAASSMGAFARLAREIEEVLPSVTLDGIGGQL